MSSPCSVDMHFGRGEMVILGTQYAGEMKKGILTLMMYRMPKLGQLCLHSSANEDPKTGAPACFMPCAAPAFAAPALMSFAASAIDAARQGA
jgi:ATP-dependent phosphoenolpyruvate carboxykinase